MSKIFKPLMMSALVAGAVGNVQAESDITFIPSASIVQKNLKYGRSFVAAPAKADFVAVAVSGTLVFDKIYTTLEFGDSITDGKLDDNTGEVSGNSSLTFTVGCNCLSGAERLNVFAGYTSVSVDIAGAPLGGGTQVDETSEDAGLFFGASYPVYINDSGQLSISVGYASLVGDVKIEGTVTNTAFSQLFDGETTGVSFGVSWGGILTDNLNYSLSFKVQDYTFISDPLSLTGNSADIQRFVFDRTLTMGSANIIYFF